MKRARQPRSYAPASRLLLLTNLLRSPRGVTLDEIATKLGKTRKTAGRMLRALQDQGEPIYEEQDPDDPRRKIWRLQHTGRRETIELTMTQMLTLFLSRRVFDFLAGTGFKEDLDDVFATLEATLRKKEYLVGKSLDRKIYDVNEAPHIYAGRLNESVNIKMVELR